MTHTELKLSESAGNSSFTPYFKNFRYLKWPTELGELGKPGKKAEVFVVWIDFVAMSYLLQTIIVR